MELTRSERPSLIYQPISAYPFLDKAETAADIQTISSGLSPSLPYFTSSMNQCTIEKTLFHPLKWQIDFKFVHANVMEVEVETTHTGIIIY